MPAKVRFGAYELDVAGMELRKNGVRLHLQEQPFLVLATLVSRPGEVIAREELQHQVWANDTFVDFDQSLNKAVNRLREVLNDDAAQPRYIETIPRRGYRFVAHVESVSAPPEGPLAPPEADNAAAHPAVPAQPARRRSRWPYVAGGAVAIFAATIFWLTRPLPPPRITGTVQLTYDGKSKFGPILTDGSRLYFNSVSGAGALPTDFLPYQVSVKGGEPVALPAALEGLLLQDISSEPSDLLLARPKFTHQSFSSGTIWTAPVMAGAPRRLGDLVLSDTSWEPLASWSPDGRRIVYSNDGHDLLVARNDGTEVHKLATFPGSPFAPRWSPDGSKVRFSLISPKIVPPGPALWEVSIDGSNPHPLLPGWNTPAQGTTRWHCCGNWTRDGKYFVFHSGQSGHPTNVWAIREKTGLLTRASREPVQLTTGPMHTYHPASSADGKRLFVIGETLRAELIRYDLTSGQSAPFLPGLSALLLDFSRDGKWVTYVSYPQYTLWRNSADGGQPLELTSPLLTVRRPAWSPDGRQIVFEGALGAPLPKPPQIYVVSVDGGTAQALTDDKSFELGAFDPSWSPDGNSIVFGDSYDSGQAPKVRRLHLLNLKTHSVSNLPGSEGLWSPRWSPDGHSLVVIGDTADTSKIMLYDIETQRRTELAERVSYPTWSRDGQFVYFYVWGKERAWWRVRVRDRKLELIRSRKDVPEPGDYWFTPAPDGSIITWRDIRATEIYALDWETP